MYFHAGLAAFGSMSFGPNQMEIKWIWKRGFFSRPVFAMENDSTLIKGIQIIFFFVAIVVGRLKRPTYDEKKNTCPEGREMYASEAKNHSHFEGREVDLSVVVWDFGGSRREEKGESSLLTRLIQWLA